MDKPRLSYVLASYTPGAWDHVQTDLARLRSLGFGVVTFVPTYYVVENGDGGLALNAARTPSADAQAAAYGRALEMGFILRVTPHVEVRGRWRGELDLDPLGAMSGGSYFSGILEPALRVIGRAIEDAGNEKSKAVLTLGSELELSLLRHPGRWHEVLVGMRELREKLQLARRVAFCHNLNWDHRWRGEFNAPHDAYLAGLDRVSLSYYPPVLVAAGRANAEKTVARLSDDRRKAYERCLKTIARLNPVLDIGEMGIGSGSYLRPYYYEDAAFEGDSGADARLRRRLYWGAMLQFLSECGRRRMSVPPPRHATIWSVGVYNILGAGGESTRADSSLTELIRRYNASAG